jgi:uncharacterized protein
MPYFVDTAFFLALVLERDQYHEAAVHWQQKAEGGFVTTDYVLVETVNGLSQQKFRPIADVLVRQVSAANEFEVIPASKELLDSGVALFRNRPDKDWSLTDCISFVVMADLRLTEALTSDHHFEQAGFRALLIRPK